MNAVSKVVSFALFLFVAAMPTLPQESTCEKRLLPVFVTDKDGRMVTTLTSVDFKLGSRSGSMSVVALKHDERRRRVVIMLDVSASMRGLLGPPLWPIAMALAQHVSHAGGENSDFALVLFAGHALETIGFSRGSAAVQKRLEEIAKDPAFPMPRKENDSKIYDVVKEEVLNLKNSTSADSLLVITDGADEGSTAKPDQITQLLSSSMIRVFTILVDPVQGEPSSIATPAFLRIVKRSGGAVFGPIGSGNAAFGETAKAAEAQKVLEERAQQFYRGIFANDLLELQAPSAIQIPETVDLTLTDSARREMKKVQIHFPHEIGPCTEISSSPQNLK